MQISAFVVFIAAAIIAYNALSGKTDKSGNISGADGKDTSSGQDGEIRTKAPDFTVYDNYGSPVKLSDMLGKPVVLNFWASWCPPCKGEMPEFDAVYRESGGGITFMMVDLVDEMRETKDKGAAYYSGQGYSMPVYFDTKQDAAIKYGISSIPVTLFIDKDGYIAAGSQGAIDAKTLRKGMDMIR